MEEKYSAYMKDPLIAYLYGSYCIQDPSYTNLKYGKNDTNGFPLFALVTDNLYFSGTADLHGISFKRMLEHHPCVTSYDTKGKTVTKSIVIIPNTQGISDMKIYTIDNVKDFTSDELRKTDTGKIDYVKMKEDGFEAITFMAIDKDRTELINLYPYFRRWTAGTTVWMADDYSKVILSMYKMKVTAKMTEIGPGEMEKAIDWCRS